MFGSRRRADRSTGMAGNGRRLGSPDTPAFGSVHLRRPSKDVVALWKGQAQTSWVVSSRGEGDLVVMHTEQGGRAEPAASTTLKLPAGRARDLGGSWTTTSGSSEEVASSRIGMESDGLPRRLSKNRTICSQSGRSRRTMSGRSVTAAGCFGGTGGRGGRCSLRPASGSNRFGETEAIRCGSSALKQQE